MSLSRSVGFVSLFCVATSLATGCGDDDPIEAITNEVTCSDVCNRYKDCFDDGYDVDECVDRCTNDATAEEEKEDKLEACNDCIDDKSCTGAVFNCAVE